MAKYVIVELTDVTDAEDTHIEVSGGKNYAVGTLEEDVVCLVDWGYRSPEEARATWKEIDGKPTLQGELARKKLEA